MTPDGVHIAYSTLGPGPHELILCGDWLMNGEAFWESSDWAGFADRLRCFSRFTLIDARGSGGSDRVPLEGMRTYEQAAGDVLVVMDELGIERAFVSCHAHGTPVGALFAAGHPERTAGLVLISPFASLFDRGDGVGFASEQRQQILDLLVTGMGDADSVWARLATPGDDPRSRAEREVVARQQRLGASPGTWRALMEMTVDYDIRDVLRTLRVPTLVLHRRRDAIVDPALSRHVASLVPGAKVTEVPGKGHFFTSGSDWGWVDDIEEFVTGARPVAGADRVLATLLFTDIVGSTDRAAALGDSAWRAVLARHDEVVRGVVERHRGRFVKSTGDGMLATFDGPARAVRCALAARDAVSALGLEIRAGLHTGEIEVTGGSGAAGAEIAETGAVDVAGIAVHIAARVSALAGSGEILVSAAVPPLVTGSGLVFADRGEHELKGVPGRWAVFAVEG